MILRASSHHRVSCRRANGDAISKRCSVAMSLTSQWAPLYFGLALSFLQPSVQGEMHLISGLAAPTKWALWRRFLL